MPETVIGDQAALATAERHRAAATSAELRLYWDGVIQAILHRMSRRVS